MRFPFQSRLTLFTLVGLLLATFGAFGGARALNATDAHTTHVAAPVLREFTLTAQEVDWEIMPGTVVKAWTFNGTMPGPELRATEGDLVRVTLNNTLPVPTTIHWHGIDVPNGMDGVPGVTQEAVPPGGSFTYEFIATNPGTRWYHSHQDSEIQVPLGLYGSFIIDPRVPPPGAATYDREYTYVLSEWSLALTPDVALGNTSLPTSGRGAPHSKQLDFDLFLLNGKAHGAIPRIEVQEGERVLVRLINAGALVHTMHPHGHSVKLVATDGNFIPPAAQLLKDSITLGPGERADIELHATNPGVWMFHCHMQHHGANGMMTGIQYEGVAPPIGSGAGGGEHTHAAPTPAPAAEPASPPTGQPADLPTNDAVAHIATQIRQVDNRFQPGNITVPVGTTVAWPNVGANIHTVSSYDGTIESGAVPPGHAFVWTFDKPGTFEYLCRQHLLNGMIGRVVVE